jgi:hypothetical protein
MRKLWIAGALATACLLGAPLTAGAAPHSAPRQVNPPGPGTPDDLELQLAKSTNPVGKTVFVDATVTDPLGDPSVGVTIHFTVTGANQYTGTGATGGDGVGYLGYVPSAPGTDTMTAWVDNDGDGKADGYDPINTITIYVTPAVTPTPTPTQTQTPPPDTQPTTDLSDVSPVDSSGDLRPGYSVTRRLGGGECSFGSDAVGSAYRCFTRNDLLDPCWVTSNLTSVDCLLEGWEHTVVHVTVSKGFSNVGFTKQTYSGFVPWGIQLTDGKRCGITEGAVDFVGKSGQVTDSGGRRVNYYCENSLKMALVGNVDVSRSLWRIRRYQVVGSYSSKYHYRSDGWAKISRAWYALPTLRGY